MVRGRISQKTRDRFKNSIRDVLEGLSRRIQVYKQPVKSECPNCYFDKLTGRSTGKCKWTAAEIDVNITTWLAANPSKSLSDAPYKYFRVGRCPICRGNGFLEVRRKAYANCVVIWNPSSRYDNSTVYTAAGTEGSTVVQLKTDSHHYALFKNCSRIIVDGIECKLSKPPTLRGLGSQAVLIIEAFTTEKPKVDSGEVVKDY